MWHIRKIDPIDLIAERHYISFVGAGGKTSFIEYLAKETAKRNKKTVITTTTKIYAREPYVLLTERKKGNHYENNPIQIGKTIENNKLTGVTSEDIHELGKVFDIVLIEADGAKGKPLKCPAPYEPVIPPFSDMVFVIAGLDSLSGQIKENVFRWENIKEKMGMSGDEIISPKIFGLFFADNLLLKDVKKSPCTIVLNKYDACAQRKPLFHMAAEIIRKTRAERVIISSLAFRIFHEIRYFNQQ